LLFPCTCGRFTTPGADLRLNQTYVLSSNVFLDAAGLSSPVTIRAAPRSPHFNLTTSANLTADSLVFADGMVVKSGAGVAVGGSMRFYKGSIGIFKR
jgi:homoserine acetyltransferase